jgi:hypothetical protein
MNDELDSLETELASLAPRDVSPQLARRVAAELAEDAAVPLGRWGYRQVAAAIAVGALAASAVAVAWLWRDDERTTQVNPPTDSIALPLAVAFDPALPSVWSLRRAAQSALAPDELLDELLDRHSGRRPPEPPHYVQIRGFGVSETERNDLLGEL